MTVIDVGVGVASAPIQPVAAARISLPSTLPVLFGSEMGNAEIVADNLGEALTARGINAECLALNDQPVDALAGLNVALIVISTCGEGDMPYLADQFWSTLEEESPDLSGLHYAVLALGDSGYTYFCGAGVRMDDRLAQLGATRLASRVDCDVDYEIPADRWIAERVEQLTALTGGGVASGESTAETTSLASTASQWTRDRPFEAALLSTELLSGPGSAKEIRHYELDLTGSGIAYQPGDSIAIVPTNDPDAVQRFLESTGFSGDEDCSGVPLRVLAERRWELRYPSAGLIDLVATRSPDSDLARALATGLEAGDHLAVEEWIRMHGVCETLAQLREPLALDELAPVMSPMRYRAYSIASSPIRHPEAVHLTVATQRNADGAVLLSGVGSGHLADRLPTGATVGVYPLPNRSFRLPADPSTPIVMIGPGVGVAPFRGFLQHRAESADRGPAWLFYGDQHEASDFSYREFFEGLLADGVLTRLDTAFSRDHAQKVYVQDRMRENAAELVSWIQDGAYLYICGDGKRMAADVDAALNDIAAERLGPEAGRRLIEQLHHEKRYLRDVY
ncbi:sulfite reductase flavoprotein subunit alpha [Rathayibacter sp. VKM Ac-2835]|uniref:diflavin oxidoreductase n=1 Tax=Rathayibacter sp. VKM Ac-2835 TaxID=2739043 RepID=UPI001567857B|nr:sulfite reductase flavoprotein subunit alpha [Rathayibacter sp. VKM Ac-2835]NRG41034.1 sulfite reductase flavoprotein subunit alpha [Rathayibacter sp. VKM Ac-2835]